MQPALLPSFLYMLTTVASRKSFGTLSSFHIFRKRACTSSFLCSCCPPCLNISVGSASGPGALPFFSSSIASQSPHVLEERPVRRIPGIEIVTLLLLPRLRLRPERCSVSFRNIVSIGCVYLLSALVASRYTAHTFTLAIPH